MAESVGKMEDECFESLRSRVVRASGIRERQQIEAAKGEVCVMCLRGGEGESRKYIIPPRARCSALFVLSWLFSVLVELAGTFLEAIYRNEKREKKINVCVVWCPVRK